MHTLLAFYNASAAALLLRALGASIVVEFTPAVEVVVGRRTASLFAVVAFVPGFLAMIADLATFVVELAHVLVPVALRIDDHAAGFVRLVLELDFALVLVLSRIGRYRHHKDYGNREKS